MDRLRKGLQFLCGQHLRGWRRWLFLLSGWIPIGLVGFVVFCNLWVLGATHRFIAKDVDSARVNDVALVLGTSKMIAPGRANHHFKNRIRTAAELFWRKKVQHVLVSGDNGTKYYNEPRDMRDALIELGVPPAAITRDFAGFRTLDSMVRAREVFQLDEFTVVTDPFHLPRAIFIARHNGSNVTGVASKRVPFRSSFNTEVRECLARVKAVLDVYVFDTRPRLPIVPEPIVIHR